MVEVLVEHCNVTEWTDQTRNRALNLANFLSQDQLEDTTVLKCVGVCQNKALRHFEYIFDASEFAKGFALDGTTHLITNPRPRLHTLREELENGLFRYSRVQPKPHDNAKKPLSISAVAIRPLCCQNSQQPTQGGLVAPKY